MNIHKGLYRGKRILLFPLCIILVGHSLRAQWSQVFNILSNFQRIPAVDCSQIRGAEQKVELNFQYDDVYRKKLSGFSAISINRNSYIATATIPFREKSQILLVKTAVADLSADNQNDQTSVQMDLSAAVFDYSAVWAMFKQTHSLGLRGHYRQSESSADLVINSYPSSDDSNLNRYFLNWLPLTFSNPITSQTKSKSIEMGAWYSRLINQHYHIRFLLNNLRSDNQSRFQYFNTTNKVALNGKRLLDIPVNWQQTLASIVFFQMDKTRPFITISYNHARLKYSTDNHPPSFIDYKSLGKGAFDNDGLAILAEHSIRRHQVSAGISYSQFDGDFSLQTPVLGYITFGIIPVAHSAKGHISKGTVFSQKLGCFSRYRLNRTDLEIALDYTHSRFQLRFLGEAQLEFGLLSAPINYPVQIDANIFDVQSKLERRFNQFSLFYDFRQIIPVFKRLDDSPIRITKPVPGKITRERGGQIHKFGIGYYF
ncbi:hypothetical protein KJ688_14380 [bacterium]|nr:hypothetical protein [bacterium]